MVIERRDHREDDRTGLGGQRHVAQMNAVEGRLSHAKNQRAAFLERNEMCIRDSTWPEELFPASLQQPQQFCLFGQEGIMAVIRCV